MFVNGIDRSVLTTRTPTHDRSKTMKHSVHTLIIISALLLIAGPAFGAAYLKFDGVDGESKERQRDVAAKKKSDPTTAGRSATKAQPTGNSTPKPAESPRTGQTPPSRHTSTDQFSLNYEKIRDRKDQPVGRTPANPGGETSSAEGKR